MFCESCQCEIKNKGYWKRHVQSKKHIRNSNVDIIEDVTEEDNTVVDVPVVEPTVSYCTHCDKNISVINWGKHIKTRKHLKNLKTVKTQIEEYKMKEREMLEYLKLQDERHKEQHERHLEERRELLDIIQTIKNEMVNIKHTPTTTNNNTTTNIQNNFTINIYGQEDFKSLLSGDNIKEIKRGNLLSIVNTMMRVAYLDRKENRNIQYTNTRSNQCKVLTENGWKARDINAVFGERLLNVGEIYPNSITEYGEDAKEDMDDLIVMTQDIKKITKGGNIYIDDDTNGFSKIAVKETKTLKSNHLTDIYNCENKAK